MKTTDHVVKYWPMAELEDGTILNTNIPPSSIRNCIEIVKVWDKENFIKEAWIDMTMDDNPDPVKRIPLIRDWDLGKSIVLKEGSNDHK